MTLMVGKSLRTKTMILFGVLPPVSTRIRTESNPFLVSQTSQREEKDNDSDVNSNKRIPVVAQRKTTTTKSKPVGTKRRGGGTSRGNGRGRKERVCRGGRVSDDFSWELYNMYDLYDPQDPVHG